MDQGSDGSEPDAFAEDSEVPVWRRLHPEKRVTHEPGTETAEAPACNACAPANPQQRTREEQPAEDYVCATYEGDGGGEGEGEGERETHTHTVYVCVCVCVFVCVYTRAYIWP